MMGKIGELLSDKESVKQLSELAQMFMSGTDADEGNTSDSEQTEDESTGGVCENGGTSQENSSIFPDGFDFNAIAKLYDIMGTIKGNDKNSEFLLALKPHLREERQEKVDKAVKLLKLLAIWNVVKESGMLKDLI